MLFDESSSCTWRSEYNVEQEKQNPEYFKWNLKKKILELKETVHDFQFQSGGVPVFVPFPQRIKLEKIRIWGTPVSNLL